MEEEIISPMAGSSNNAYTSPYSINGIDINYSLQANIKYDEMASFAENNIKNYSTVTTIPTNYLPKNINSSKCENWNSAFSGMQSLQSLPEPFYNTSNMRNIDNIFYGCNSLTINNFMRDNNGNLSLNNINSMVGAFSQVKQLNYNSVIINANNCNMKDAFEMTEIKTNSGIYISNIGNAQGMFYSTVFSSIDNNTGSYSIDISIDGESMADMFLEATLDSTIPNNFTFNLKLSDSVINAAEAFLYGDTKLANYACKTIMEDNNLQNIRSCFEEHELYLDNLNFPKNAIDIRSIFYNSIIHTNAQSIEIYENCKQVADSFLKTNIVGPGIKIINIFSNNINSCSSFVSDPLCPVSVDGEIVTNVRCYKDSKTWNSFYKFFGNSTFNTIYGMQLEAM